jgi:hypothetical protein
MIQQIGIEVAIGRFQWRVVSQLEEIIKEFPAQFMHFSGYTQYIPTTTVMVKGHDVHSAIEGDEIRIFGAIFLPWMIRAERTNCRNERQISGRINVLLRVCAKLSNYI